MKNIILVLGLMILSPSLLAQSRSTQILTVLPEGIYNGEDCQVLVGTGFVGLGVVVSINHLNQNDNLVQTSFQIYDDSPWTQVLNDRSTSEMIDLKVKRNTGLVQRLVIENGKITIQDFKGSRIRTEVHCQI